MAVFRTSLRFTLLAVLLRGTCTAVDKVNIDLSLGRIIGKREGGLYIFLGIPFAEPPIHTLRFRPSKPKQAWTPQAIECFNFSAMCLQSSLYSQEDDGKKSEDCLYLNVWAPAKPSKQGGYPVLLWIYGGAFMQGSASSPMYIGDRLAARGVVVVSCNYRLGALGFMVSTKDGLFGNYGLHDQKLAMQWVQDHIYAFGGNPDKVTLFGESAGAMSIGLHLLDQYGKRLFRAVVLQSNPLGYKYRSVTVANFIGSGFKDALDCEDLRCLQSESTDELMHVQDTFMAVPRSIGDFFTWGPVVTDSAYKREVRIRYRRDMAVCNVSVQQPLQILKVLSRFDIPVILGSNTHEGNVFVYTAFPTRMNKLIFQAITFSFFKGDSPKVLKAYASRTRTISSRPNPDYREVLSEIIGDYLFRCPTRLAASLMHDLGAPVWLFEFALATRTPGFPCCDGLSCHTAELPYVFEQVELIEKEYTWSFDKGGSSQHCTSNSWIPLVSMESLIDAASSWVSTAYTRVRYDAKVAKLMADYWTLFAINGDPNGVLSRNGYGFNFDGTPYWPMLSGRLGSRVGEETSLGMTTSKTKGISGTTSNKVSDMKTPDVLSPISLPFLYRPGREMEDRYMHVFHFNKTSEPYIQKGDCYCDNLWNRLDYKF